MKYRIEKDTMGEVNVPYDALWGAQTQRALENFKITFSEAESLRKSISFYYKSVKL